MLTLLFRYFFFPLALISIRLFFKLQFLFYCVSSLLQLSIFKLSLQLKEVGSAGIQTKYVLF